MKIAREMLTGKTVRDLETETGKEAIEIEVDRKIVNEVDLEIDLGSVLIEIWIEEGVEVEVLTAGSVFDKSLT